MRYIEEATGGGLYLYTIGSLFHAEWCIRLTALVFFYHTL